MLFLPLPGSDVSFFKNTPLVMVGRLCESESGVGKGISDHKGISEPPGSPALQ